MLSTHNLLCWKFAGDCPNSVGNLQCMSQDCNFLSMWLIGAVVCMLAANRWSSCSITWTIDGRIVRCGVI